MKQSLDLISQAKTIFKSCVSLRYSNKKVSEKETQEEVDKLIRNVIEFEAQVKAYFQKDASDEDVKVIGTMLATIKRYLCLLVSPQSNL